MRHILVALFLLVVSAPAMADQAVVVFMPGLGDGAESFRPVIRKMKALIAPIADRRPRRSPGMADGRLTPTEAAQELHARLQEKGAAPPYILVAHSISSLHALEFARLYPRETKSLLLVDPRLPGFDRRCEAAGLPICTVPPALFALLPAQQKAELRGATEMLSAPAQPKLWSGTRMTLMVATRPAPGLNAAYQATWRAHAASFVKSLPRADLITAEGAGHYIQREATDSVISALTSHLQNRP